MRRAARRPLTTARRALRPPIDTARPSPAAVRLLEDLERLDLRRSLGPGHVEPETFALAQMAPADVERDRQAVLAHDDGRPEILDRVAPAGQALRRHALGRGPAAEPQAQVDQRQPEIEQRPAPRLLPA